jgi:hypothetical protein
MKKVMLVLLVFVSLTKVSNAQKGSILLYGNVGFSAATDSFGTSSNAYNFNPGIGLQLNDKWTAGLNIGIGGSRSEVTTASVPTGNYNTTSTFNIGPFIRYAYPISNLFSVYGQFELNYLSGKSTPYLLDEGSYSGFGTDFFPAIGMNIKNGWAINLSFGGISYQTKTYKGDVYNSNTGTAPNNSTSQFGITFGQGATFCISKNFGGKKS